MEVSGYIVRFSYKALKMFSLRTGLKLTEMSNLGFEHIADLLYCGLQSGASFEGKDFKLTFEQVEDMLDVDLTLMSKVLSKFAEDVSSVGEAIAPETVQ